MDAPASTSGDQTAFGIEPGIFEGEAQIRVPGKCGIRGVSCVVSCSFTTSIDNPPRVCLCNDAWFVTIGLFQHGVCCVCCAVDGKLDDALPPDCRSLQPGGRASQMEKRVVAFFGSCPQQQSQRRILRSLDLRLPLAERLIAL